MYINIFFISFYIYKLTYQLFVLILLKQLINLLTINHKLIVSN